MAKRFAIVLAFAVVVWANCGAIMGIGPLFLSMDATLVVHAIGGPLGAAVAFAATWLTGSMLADRRPA